MAAGCLARWHGARSRMRPPKQPNSQCPRDKASSAWGCATGKLGTDLPAFAPNHFVGGQAGVGENFPNTKPADCQNRHKALSILAPPGGAGRMFKSLVVIGALAVAAPSLALAQGNLNNTPASQNANGLSSVSQKRTHPLQSQSQHSVFFWFVFVDFETITLLIPWYRRARSFLEEPRRAGSGLGQLGQRGVISSLI